MEISEQGLDLIKQFEGCRLVAYMDSVGVWTIGYGSTVDVAPGMQITKVQADERLKRDVKDAEDCINSLVNVALQQCQFDALVSWVFNLGCGNLKKSTLLKMLNEGRFDDASFEMKKWDRAGGKVVEGLTRRRVAEARLFDTEVT